MFKFPFLNLAKPKKVFEKLNKMDRKQAYTVGAIVVVAVIALLLLITSFDTSDPMEGMNPRGYDLAQMPFLNDEAEKMLLSSYYPDMRENGSTLLYTPLEREQRQQEDEKYELVPVEENPSAGEPESAPSEQADSQGQAGAAGEEGAGVGRGPVGGNGKGGGRGRTEIGKLEKGGMATGAGSGISSFWGPSVNNQGLQGQTGYVAPAQLQTGDARKALQQFRAGSYAANRLRDNKMANARKAMMGGNVQGSDAFGKDGVDLEKLGGLALDPSEMPHTTDLNNLDKALDKAIKDNKPEKLEEKVPWWKEMLRNLAQQAASALVDAVMSGVGDTIKAQINGNAASRAAGKEATTSRMNVAWDKLDATERTALGNSGITKEQWNGGQVSTGKAYRALKGHSATIDSARSSAKADAKNQVFNNSSSSSKGTQVGQSKCDSNCLKNCSGKEGDSYSTCLKNCGC